MVHVLGEIRIHPFFVVYVFNLGVNTGLEAIIPPKTRKSTLRSTAATLSLGRYRPYSGGSVLWL